MLPLFEHLPDPYPRDVFGINSEANACSPLHLRPASTATTMKLLIVLLSAVAVHSASLYDRYQFEKDVASQLDINAFHKAMEKLNKEVGEQAEEEKEEVKGLLASAVPIGKEKAEEEEEEEAVNKELSSDLFEGDIVLTNEQVAAISEANSTDRSKRQAFIVKYPSNIWPTTGVVPFSFAAGVSDNVKALFREATKFWSENTCIRFQENGAGTNKIVVVSKGGCYSSVGMVGGTQELSLNNEGCAIFATASHELEHALGVFHEQSRYDRDTYISLNKDNISPTMLYNFDKETQARTSNFDVPYEFGSNMHYTPDSFAKNYEIPSIIATSPYKEYQNSMRGHQPSFLDILLVNKFYKCDQKCAGRQNFCQNGGYLDVNTCTTCKCPEGWGGRDCTQKPDGCVVELTASTQYQSKSVTLGNYGEKGIRFTTCTYLINAPAGKRIEVKFDGLWGGWGQGCKTGGVEIKTKKDLRARGFRFCGEKPAASVWSETNRLPVILFRNNDQIRADIQFRYA